VSGREWRCRPVRRGDYDLEVDGSVAVFVSLQHGVERPSLLMQRIAALIAEHHGDQVEGRAGVDWAALGWADQAEHDGMVAELAAVVRSWRGHHLQHAAIAYVNAEKLAAGIPAKDPYSVDQLDELDRIIRRAPTVVAQDAAAEGTAA
jgi:hypothetical protein